MKNVNNVLDSIFVVQHKLVNVKAIDCWIFFLSHEVLPEFVFNYLNCFFLSHEIVVLSTLSLSLEVVVYL